jgi:hypothetical protein
MSGSGTGGLYATSNVFDMSQSPKQNSLKGANGVGIGSEAWGHAYCWIVLEDPSGNRQIIIQRDSSNTDAGDDEWYFGYSLGGRFGEGETAGVDWDATTLPTAPDQYNLFGTPTSWSTMFQAGGSADMFHVAADDTPSPSGEYGVLMLEMYPSRTQGAIFMLDDVRGAATGDPHPLVLFVNSDPGVLTIGNIGGRSTPKYAYSIIDPNGPGQARISMLASYLEYANSNVLPSQGGVGVDNIERVMPYVWGFADNFTWLGLSRWLRWQANGQQYPATAASRTFLYVNDTIIEGLWDGATVPLAL